MKPKKLLVFAFGVAVAAALALVTLPAAAQDPDWHQLRGTYFTTGQTSCFASSTGFTDYLTPSPTSPVVYFQSATSQYTVKYQPDGTGTGTGSEFYITLPPATVPSASSNTVSFSFTYTVADDGVLSLVFGPVTGTFTAGPFTGVPFSVTPPPLSGRIGRNGTITLTSTVPTVETLTIYFPAPIGTVNITRICNRSRVSIPIHGED